MHMFIDFPNLGIHLEHVGKALTIAGFDIAYYGMAIGLGILAGLSVAMMEAKRTGQNPDTYIDVAMYGVVFGIIGARIYYVAFSWDMYKDDLLSILNLRQGGLAIYGGVIAAVITVFVFAKIKKIHPGLILDTAGPGLVLGQAFGRWGNFFNREAFGGPTDSLFAMCIPTEYFVEKGNLTALVNSGTITQEMIAVENYDAMQWISVHPTFLYESLWNILILIIIIVYRKHKKFDGELGLIYLWGYGLGRVWIEALRTDSLMVPGIDMKVSQLIAAICVLAASIVLVRMRMKYAAGVVAETSKSEE